MAEGSRERRGSGRLLLVPGLWMVLAVSVAACGAEPGSSSPATAGPTGSDVVIGLTSDGGRAPRDEIAYSEAETLVAGAPGRLEFSDIDSGPIQAGRAGSLSVVEVRIGSDASARFELYDSSASAEAAIALLWQTALSPPPFVETTVAGPVAVTLAEDAPGGDPEALAMTSSLVGAWLNELCVDGG